MAKFPVRGEWLLSNPKMLWRDNPPFAVLTVDFRSKTGTVRRGRLGAQDYAEARLDHIFTKLDADGAPKFHSAYRIHRAKGGFDSGKIEATTFDKYELEVEFTGTVETCVNAHPSGAASIEEGDLGIEAKSPKESPPPVRHITCAGDIAREFDSLVEENNREIRAWAEETIANHPGAWWAVGLAKTGYDVPVVLGQGMVDALKLGEGTGEAIWQAEDGWGVAKGVGQDALRLLQFIPAFKALKYVKAAGTEARVVGAEVRAAGAEARALNAEVRSAGSAARPPVTTVSPRPVPRAPLAHPPFLTGVDKMPRQGICTWVAMTKAYRVFKCTSLFSVHDLMKLACLDNVKIAGTSLRQLIPTFARLGVRLRQLGRLVPHVTEGEKIAELARAERPGAVIVFHVRWMKRVGDQFNEPAHALVGFNSPQHGFCIIDRYDTPIVRSLAELERYYPSISKSFIAEAYVFEEASIKVVNQAGRLVPMIALPVSVALHAVIPTGTPNGAAATTSAAGVSGGTSAQATPR
jgi:hypothetical protein